LLQPRHERVCAKRAAGTFRAAQLREDSRLRLDVDQRRDAAEPLDERRRGDERIVATGKMRAQAPGRSCATAGTDGGAVK
jgi:hypothetical protein